MIFGRDVDNTIRTFGWSLSGGMDLDNNEYPDLLVGAYESTSAVYLRSAPVVHLDSKVASQMVFFCLETTPNLVYYFLFVGVFSGGKQAN